MKVSSVIAILALLGVAQGTQTVKSLLERASDDEDMDVSLVDTTSKTHKKNHHHRHHPHENNMVRTQTESSPRVTNEGRPLDEIRKSFDQTGQDQSDRKTDTMFESDKHYEDTFYQGSHSSSPNTGTKNAPGIADHVPVMWHTLPKRLEKLAPTNMPTHMHQGDYKAATTMGQSATGIYLVYITVDSEEHASRFVKDLFRLGLIAMAEMQEGGFDRSYLKFGRIQVEKGRTRLQLTTSDARLVELIDYCNNENPTHYDYPVPNTIALPVSTSNDKYVAWVKEQTSTDSGKIKYEAEKKSSTDDE